MIRSYSKGVTASVTHSPGPALGARIVPGAPVGQVVAPAVHGPVLLPVHHRSLPQHVEDVRRDFESAKAVLPGQDRVKPRTMVDGATRAVRRWSP